jgi:hypothetical protein
MPLLRKKSHQLWMALKHRKKSDSVTDSGAKSGSEDSGNIQNGDDEISVKKPVADDEVPVKKSASDDAVSVKKSMSDDAISVKKIAKSIQILPKISDDRLIRSLLTQSN